MRSLVYHMRETAVHLIYASTFEASRRQIDLKLRRRETLVEIYSAFYLDILQP